MGDFEDYIWEEWGEDGSGSGGAVTATSQQGPERHSVHWSGGGVTNEWTYREQASAAHRQSVGEPHVISPPLRGHTSHKLPPKLAKLSSMPPPSYGRPHREDYFKRPFTSLHTSSTGHDSLSTDTTRSIGGRATPHRPPFSSKPFTQPPKYHPPITSPIPSSMTHPHTPISSTTHIPSSTPYTTKLVPSLLPSLNTHLPSSTTHPIGGAVCAPSSSTVGGVCGSEEGVQAVPAALHSDTHTLSTHDQLTQQNRNSACSFFTAGPVK